MPSSPEAVELFRRYVIGNYTRFPVCLVRGEGSYVWDAEGNRYLDFFPGWGCDLLGHCPPRWSKRCAISSGRLIHVPNTWYTEPQGLLARALSERSGVGRPVLLLQQRHRGGGGGDQNGAFERQAGPVQDHHR